MQIFFLAPRRLSPNRESHFAIRKTERMVPIRRAVTQRGQAAPLEAAPYRPHKIYRTRRGYTFR
jgi:hypothetical protein